MRQIKHASMKYPSQYLAASVRILIYDASNNKAKTLVFRYQIYGQSTSDTWNRNIWPQGQGTKYILFIKIILSLVPNTIFADVRVSSKSSHLKNKPSTQYEMSININSK